jgi:hypothetical protein
MVGDHMGIPRAVFFLRFTDCLMIFGLIGVLWRLDWVEFLFSPPSPFPTALGLHRSLYSCFLVVCALGVV